MATPSLTTFRDNGTDLVTIHCTYDGYPSGHGRDLAEIITHSTADIGTLAVQVIARLKSYSDEVRLSPSVSSIGWQGYSYVVTGDNHAGVNIRIEYAGKTLFAGSASDCLKFCSNQD